MGNIAVTLRSFHYVTPTSLLRLYSSLFLESKPTTHRIAPTTQEGECNSHMEEEEAGVSSADVKVVMERLGLEWEVGDDSCVDSVHHMAEEKEASEDELAQAFAVFDEDGDGYMTAEELRRVMRRLRFGEGMRLEDCRRMIEVFDEDADGRIDLREFRKLLERVL